MLTMMKFSPTIAVALLATAVATPVFAQAAIQEPGAYAFYHPNADTVARSSAVRPPDSADAYAYYRSAAPKRDRLPVAPRHRRTVR
jgi:hypothetical protein